MERILSTIYYDPKNPSAFTGVEKVYQEAKLQLPDITRRDVREWLEKQYTYTMHKPTRRKFPRRRMMVNGIDDQWQIDLADMVRVSRYNDGYQYLLTCIDIFSKYAWVVPLKNKGGNEVGRAMESIFREGRVPRKIQSDKGREFLNHIVQGVFERRGIHHFTSEDPQIKCAVVERFNRTLKGRIWKYFTKSRLYRYINVLPDIVEGYNNSVHRTIGRTPASVTSSLDTTYLDDVPLDADIPSLKVGDRVRISRAKMIFEKGYLPNWTEEIFTISKILPTHPITYQLKDYYGEDIKGSFYEAELQKTEVEEYWIEKVIKRKGDKALVKWLGYKKLQWIPIADIAQK